LGLSRSATDDPSERSDSLVISGLGPLPFKPSNILPDMPGKYGFSIPRMLVATTTLAISLGLMRIVPNMAIAAAVIPLWCMSVGILVDGRRGALRGVITAVVYPIYCAMVLAVAFAVFWTYAMVHRLIAGDQIFW
jgi:hypothetical protein